jgi:hypothetical protein
MAVLALAGATGLFGCASSHDAPPPTDETSLVQVVKSFNGSTSDPRNAPQWFVQGSVPPAAELQKFAKYDCRVVGKPTIKGDTATIKMRVLVRQTDNEVGQVDWTLVKVGDTWKVKSAPLP